MKTLLLALAAAVSIAGAVQAGTISGNVYYQTSSTPVAGQVVSLWDTGHTWSTTVTTDAMGNYSVTVPSTVPTTSPGNQIMVSTDACNFTYKSVTLNVGSSVVSFPLCSGSGATHRIYGKVSLGGLANTDTSIVYLIRKSYSTALMDTVLTKIDSIYTDINGNYSRLYTPLPTGILLVKAALIPGHPSYSSYLPTYYTGSLNWSGATALGIRNVMGSTATDINLIAGTNPGGPAFVGGSVLLGANKSAAVGDPLSKRMLILTKSTGEAVAYTYSDASGSFSFPSLPYGSYKIFGDAMGKKNPSLSITVSAIKPRVSNIIFDENDKKFEGRLTDVSVRSSELEAVSVFPNPATTAVQVRGLSTIKGVKTITLSTMTGAVISRQTVVSGDAVIATEPLPAGVYMVQLVTAVGNASFRLTK